MTNGKAAACHTPRSNTETAINVNLTLLSAHVKFLNLSANNSQGEINRNEKMRVMVTKNRSFEIKVSHGGRRKIKDVMNKALAGVGRPMNASF